MTPKQCELIEDLRMKISDLDCFNSSLRRQLFKLSENFDFALSQDKGEFNYDEINRLLCFNQRLSDLEVYLCDLGARESRNLNARVADPNDPLDDYEIDATLYFILDENDPTFDEDDDNTLTQREISLKRYNRKYGLGDGLDHRLPCRQFPGVLNEVPHCWLFYDLYEHSYGLKQPSLTFQDCIRVDSIWIDVAVRHQATLDIKSGKWVQPTKETNTPG
jgi:hypothetical protein